MTFEQSLFCDILFVKEFICNINIQYSIFNIQCSMFNLQCSIFNVIIWQDSLEVNPSVLIGSFLVGILPYGPFPWKRSYAAYFLFSKACITKRKR